MLNVFIHFSKSPIDIYRIIYDTNYNTNFYFVIKKRNRLTYFNKNKLQWEDFPNQLHNNVNENFHYKNFAEALSIAIENNLISLENTT